MLEEKQQRDASEAEPCILFLLPIFEFSNFPFLTNFFIILVSRSA
jgi:hypothetical protein